MAENALSEMPFLRNIGLIVTYKCQVACAHCILEAGPHRTEMVSKQNAFNWIKQIANYKDNYIKVLSLTGGEPFYDIQFLKEISDFAEKCGLLVSVVTNAFWATSLQRAIEILKDIPSLRVIAISTDAYHQESIPFERVVNAVMAAKKCGIPFNLHICTENEEDNNYKTYLQRAIDLAGINSVLTALTLPVGRAMNTMDISKYRVSEEPPISACLAGSSPIIFPDGRVIACIGPIIDLKSEHPLLLGNLNESSLTSILTRAECNPILHALRIWGPKRLISIIEASDLKDALPKQYIGNSICYACYSLMSNDKIASFLYKLAKDTEFTRKVAYGRVYHLGEYEMAKQYQQITE